jgi:anti-sigma B factor antagonist
VEDGARNVHPMAADEGPELEVDRTDMEAGVVRLSLRGELDLNTGFRLERVFRGVEEEPPTAIVVDLRDLRFVDSTGLAKIVAAHRRGAAGGWRVAVVRGEGIVDTVLTTTRLDAYLDVVDDPVEALLAPDERPVSD